MFMIPYVQPLHILVTIYIPFTNVLSESTCGCDYGSIPCLPDATFESAYAAPHRQPKATKSENRY